MRRSVQTACAIGVVALAMTGCGKAVPDRVAAAYASREAVSSHLKNESDVPITYNSSDHPDRDLILQPGEEVTSSGGAWMVPWRWRCAWRDTAQPKGSAIVAGSDEYVTWVTFGGYDETVTSCTAPAD